MAPEGTLSIVLSSPGMCVNLVCVQWPCPHHPGQPLLCRLIPEREAKSWKYSRGCEEEPSVHLSSRVPLWAFMEDGATGKGQLPPSSHLVPWAQAASSEWPRPTGALSRGRTVAMAMVGWGRRSVFRVGLSRTAFCRLTGNPRHQLQGP